jgi:hypothetical protein
VNRTGRKFANHGTGTRNAEPRTNLELRTLNQTSNPEPRTPNRS